MLVDPSIFNNIKKQTSEKWNEIKYTVTASCKKKEIHGYEDREKIFHSVGVKTRF